MQDRIPLYPGRVKMTPVAGQANTYDMTRADDPTQAGTPLNKATLLKDATAALFGLGTDAVPDDVLAEIGKYKQYWWQRKEYTSGTYTLDASATISLAYNTGTWWIQYSDTVSVDALGAVSLPNYTELTGSGSGPAQNALNTIKGKFFRYGGAGTGINVNTAQIYLRDSADAYWNSGLKAQGQKVIGVAGSLVATDYVQSSNRGTYPDSGFVGNYEYEYLDIPFDNAVTAPRVETGSYVGTGTYGKANPNTLTFGFVPKLVIILDPHEYHCPVVMVYGSKLASPSNSSGGNYYLRDITWSKTISWYNLSNAQYQLNDTSGTYYYFAIG